MHLGIEEFVIDTLFGGLNFGNQELGCVMFDIALLQLVFVDCPLAGRIEDRLLNLGMDDELQANLVCQLLLAAFSLGAFELLEQLLDLAVVVLEKLDCVLRF